MKFKDSYLKSSTELTYTEWLENSHEKVCLENSKHYESANKNFGKLTEAQDRIKELEEFLTEIKDKRALSHPWSETLDNLLNRGK